MFNAYLLVLEHVQEGALTQRFHDFVSPRLRLPGSTEFFLHFLLVFLDSIKELHNTPEKASQLL